MSSPHNTENISRFVEAILQEWKLPQLKIHCILTDNGSNMVAAFKKNHHGREIANIEEQQNDL